MRFFHLGGLLSGVCVSGKSRWTSGNSLVNFITDVLYHKIKQHCFGTQGKNFTCMKTIDNLPAPDTIRPLNGLLSLATVFKLSLSSEFCVLFLFFSLSAIYL